LIACTPDHGALDTSLPNQLSTGSRSLVHPDRQRCTNGAKKYVDHRNSATKPYQTKTPDPFDFFSIHCGALVGELMETSSEKSASIVVRTYLFLADGAFDGKGFAGYYA
jgi:hypothetical protein